MNQNFSRYFSSSRWARLPLHKVIAAFACVGVLTVSLGAGVVAAAVNGAPDSTAVSAAGMADSVISATATPSPTPTAAPTPTPEPTPEPDIELRMELSVVQQDLGIEVLRDVPETTPEDADASGASGSSGSASASGSASRSGSSPASSGTSSRAASSGSASSASSSSASSASGSSSASGGKHDDTRMTQEPVLGVAFKVTLTDENKKDEEYEIDPETGVTLIEDLEPGDYTVTLQPMQGYVMPDPQKVTIKKKVVYKPDEEAIQEQIKSDSEASAEDTKPEIGTAPPPADTVTYVQTSVVKKDDVREVYTVAANQANLGEGGQLYYTDGSPSPYRLVTDNGGKGFIVKAQLDETLYAKMVEAGQIVQTAARGGASIHLLGGRGWLGNSETALTDTENTGNQGGNTSGTPEDTPDPVPSSEPTTEPTAPPSETPTPTPPPSETPTPTPPPSETPTPTPESSVSPSPDPTLTPEPSVSPSPSPSQTPSPSMPKEITLLSNANEINKDHPFKLTATNEVVGQIDEISGWYPSESDKQYYYDPATHQPLTSTVEIIGGERYTFDGNGHRVNELQGIDVSKYQPNINWSQVKAAGIDFVIIRAGYRGWGTGALVEDPLLASHVQGARAAGVKIGLYFFTQAVNEQEAADEAGFVLSLIRKYNIPVSYPVYYDTENSDGHGAGRADHLDRGQRTANAVTFCQTIQSGGYTPGVYSYRSWLTGNLNFSSISRYKIWVAHFASQLDFPYKYDMWQYTSSGSVPGIPGRVDRNVIRN